MGPSLAFTSSSSTNMKRQFWLLPPLGARIAASRMRSCTSGGMGFGRTRRMARVVYRAS